MRKRKKKLWLSFGLLVAFILWTIAVCCVDVQAIGPQGSCVGFAKINRYVHQLTGVHFTLYIITDWLGLIPIGVCMSFGILGLIQWIQRKHLMKVDRSLLLLGGFYIVVMAVYVLFEVLTINYRPVLIGGFLEASYPSSTTMLVMCVMPTAMIQINARTGSRLMRNCSGILIGAFIAFMVTGRLISGVHWFSDIIGGALLSSGLVMLYITCNGSVQEK